MADGCGFEWRSRLRSLYAEDPSYEKVVLTYDISVCNESIKTLQLCGIKDYEIIEGPEQNEKTIIGFMPRGTLDAVRKQTKVITACQPLELSVY